MIETDFSLLLCFGERVREARAMNQLKAGYVDQKDSLFQKDKLLYEKLTKQWHQV